MKYISTDMMFWPSLKYMRKIQQNRRRREGGDEGRKEKEREKRGGREERTFLQSFPFTPLTCTGNYLTSVNHLIIDQVKAGK